MVEASPVTCSLYASFLENHAGTVILLEQAGRHSPNHEYSFTIYEGARYEYELKTILHTLESLI